MEKSNGDKLTYFTGFLSLKSTLEGIFDELEECKERSYFTIEVIRAEIRKIWGYAKDTGNSEMVKCTERLEATLLREGNFKDLVKELVGILDKLTDEL